MPKYYTPKAALRFANQDQAAFKSLGMAAEVVIACVSDHSHQHQFYSGVIRYNPDDWKRYTVIWLYGTSTETGNQDFIVPSISDVSSSAYWENHHVVPPVVPGNIAITGTNFIDGMQVYFNGELGDNVVTVDRHHLTVNPPEWPYEIENVKVVIERPEPDEVYSSPNYDLIYERRPTISDVSPDTVYNVGRELLSVTGTFLKLNSDVQFMSGAWTGSSNNSTFSSSLLLGTYLPIFPATGTYNVRVISPSGLQSNMSHDISVIYHPPVISAIRPYNTGSLNGFTPLMIAGNYFLSGALVTFDGLPVEGAIYNVAQTVSEVQLMPINTTRTAFSIFNESADRMFVYLDNDHYSVESSHSFYDLSSSFTGAISASWARVGTGWARVHDDQARFYDDFGNIDPTQYYVKSPPHAVGEVDVLVTNPESGDVSNAFPYRYIIPIPTITDARFSALTEQAQKTGSVGSVLYITGTAFDGTDPGIRVTSVRLDSGSFSLTSNVFDIFSQTKIGYTIPTLATGSRYDVSVSNSAGTATLARAFEYADVPVIDSITPISGVVAGGTEVFIYGRPFYDGGATVVRFNGVETPSLQYFGTNLISAVTPATAALGGMATISVTNNGVLEGSSANAFEYVPFPVATSVRTSLGTNRINVGVPVNVTLVGSYFMRNVVNAGVEIAEGTEISIDGGVYEPTSFIDNTQVQFSIIGYAPGFVDITPRNRGLAYGNTLVDAIEFVEAPSIIYVVPPSGPTAGGGTMIIGGGGFINTADTHVIMGGTEIVPANVTQGSPDTLSITIPAHAAGTVQVTVVNRGTATSNAFQYEYVDNVGISSATPNQVSNAGSTLVVVNGSNFGSDMTVVAVDATIFPSNASISPFNITPTQFSFYTPAGPALSRGTVDIQVTRVGNTTTLTDALTYEQQPTITSVTQNLSTLGGQTVTIVGTGFINGVTTVWVDGVQISPITVGSSTSITFTSSAHAAGTATVEVKNTFLPASTTTTFTTVVGPSIIGATVDGYESYGTVNVLSSSAHTITLAGTNFTTGGTPEIFWVTKNTTITPTSITNTQIVFTFPAQTNADAATGYFAVRNAGGTSTYFPYRFVPAPYVSSFPNVVQAHYYTGNVTLNGGRFASTCYVRVYATTGFPAGNPVRNAASYEQVAPHTINASNVIYTTPSFLNSPDWTAKIIGVFNYTTVPDEAATYAFSGGGDIIQYILNPPSVTSLVPSSLVADTTTPNVQLWSSDVTYMDSLFYNMRWFVGDQSTTYVDQGKTTHHPSGYYNATMPSRPAGTYKVAFGYVTSAGEKIINAAGTQDVTYTAPPTFAITITNTVSDYSQGFGEFYQGTYQVNTTPRLYIDATGGTPPYTSILETVADAQNYNPQTVSYAANYAGHLNSARWYVTKTYELGGSDNGGAQMYRWAVTDSSTPPQTLYSEHVGISYEAYDLLGGGNCVVLKTPILMSGNKIKSAGDIKIGDIVLTYSETMDTSKLIECKVIEAKQLLSQTLTITLEDGRNLRCSITHPLATDDGWIEARKLYKGQVIKGSTPGIVYDVRENGVETVMKISVDNCHTFISDGLLSHNKPILIR